MNKIQLALDPNTSVETLELLTMDEIWGVRYGVAKNTITPIKELELFARDKHFSVRYEVGKNSNSSELAKRLVLMTNAKLLPKN